MRKGTYFVFNKVRGSLMDKGLSPSRNRKYQKRCHHAIRGNIRVALKKGLWD